MRVELQVFDERVHDYVGLRDSSLRRRIESERGAFIAEGALVISRALEAGCRPRSFLLAQRWLPGLATQLARWPEIPCFVASEELIEQISGFHVHRGALASFERPEPTPWEQIIAARRVIVAQSLVDHSNTGSIMRIAAALGWGAVLISPEGADPLYRRAIKTSMGASLQVPWRRMDSGEDLERLKSAGFQLWASVLDPDAEPLGHSAPPPRLALLVGSEGSGLSRDWINHSDRLVRIPMANGVDSLNVAAATAILAHALA